MACVRFYHLHVCCICSEERKSCFIPSYVRSFNIRSTLKRKTGKEVYVTCLFLNVASYGCVVINRKINVNFATSSIKEQQ